jgi:hypothetical protein
MATISKGIKLFKDDVELTNLQEIPELGGDTEAIEITTLADAAHMYTDGIKNYGDSLVFKFLYDKTQFTSLSADGTSHEWKVELPDGASCTFNGTHSVKLDSVGVNAALTYSLAIKPNSEMVWA